MPTYVVSLEGFTPGPRFDSTAWTQGRIEQGVGAAGPWTVLETVALVPVDANPAVPATRNFTTALATSPIGWFRVVFLDAAAHEAPSGAVYSSPMPFTSDGETVAELLDQVTTEFGLDVTPAQALRAFNQAHRKMVARSKCFKAPLVLAQTVAAQAAYDMDPDILELHELTVGGKAWTRRGHRVVRAVYDGLLGFRSPNGDGIYAETFSAAGTRQVWLYPTQAAGLDIVALSSLRAPKLATTDRPLVPAEYHEALVYGTIGPLVRRTESRQGEADAFRLLFDEAIAELEAANKRVVRAGPSQARVVGYQA